MKGNRFLVFTISVCFVLSIAGFSVVACQASGDLDLSINRDNISIHGIYGRAIVLFKSRPRAEIRFI